MLELKNINLKYKNFELKDISLKFEKGEYHMLLGPSGSGKTLLLNIIAGFVKPDSGNVIFNGKDISGLSPQERNISYLFQDLALFPHMSVAENVAFPLLMRKVSKIDIQEKVKKYLDFTDVYHLRDRSISKLSGGEKQRVALARNLITESEILMLDEPFSAIDSQLKLSLKKLLKKISDLGVTIIHVTHNPEEAINLAKNITVIEDGEILSSGQYEEISKSPISKFMASFSGYKNYYYLRKILNTSDSNLISVSAEQNSEIVIQFEVAGIVPAEAKSVIIESDSILLSEHRIESSARNNFEGEVLSVFRVEGAYEIELNIGLPIWVKITEKSLNEMNIVAGKKMWVCFKASTLRLV